MPVQFNHLIIAAHDKHESAGFFTELFGPPPAEDGGVLRVVRLADGVMLLFAASGVAFPRQHYALLIGDEGFDALASVTDEKRV